MITIFFKRMTNKQRGRKFRILTTIKLIEEQMLVRQGSLFEETYIN